MNVFIFGVCGKGKERGRERGGKEVGRERGRERAERENILIPDVP